MELNDFHSLLSEISTKNSYDKKETLLQPMSPSYPVFKMKQSLKREMYVAQAMIGTLLCYWLVFYKSEYLIKIITLSVIDIGYMVYYRRKFQLLRSLANVADTLQANIQDHLLVFEKISRYYLIGSTWIVPLLYVGLLWPGFNKKFFGDAPWLATNYIFFIVLGLILTIASYYKSKWYINKLYGQHISRLKSMLQEMSSS